MDCLNALPRVKVVTGVSGGAGNVTLNLQPGAGKIWKILSAWAYQTSGGARNAAWYWTDPESPAGAQITPTIALNSEAPLALGALAASAVSLMKESTWATNTSFPSFLFAASGAAENGFVDALVLEYSGVAKLGAG